MKTNARNWLARAPRNGLRFAGLAVLVLCTGCSTVVGHKFGKGRPGLYPGTKMNSYIIRDASEVPPESPVPGYLFVTYGVLDFPLSLVADTLCLPYDLVTD